MATQYKIGKLPSAVNLCPGDQFNLTYTDISTRMVTEPLFFTLRTSRGK